MSHEKGIEAATEVISADHAYQLSYEAVSNGIKAYLEASGMVLVPREPTEEMLFAAWDRAPVDMNDMGDGYYAAAYKDMVDEAPNPFKS